jgi:hypothetical protein
MANINFPSSPTTGQQYTFAGVTYIYSAQGVWSPATSVSISSPPQGRLTLQNQTPVMVFDTLGVTAIFYTPYLGDRIPIYNGTNMVMTRFPELVGSTVDFTKNPAVVGPNQVHDWFVWNDNDTIRLGHGPAWTNDTTRSAGTVLQRIDGLWTNAVAITNGPAQFRGTFVGTTRSDSAALLSWKQGTRALGGGAAGLFVWNAYNRVDIFTEVSDSTGTWLAADTYTASLYVGGTMLNNSSSNRITFVSGLKEDALLASIWQPVYEGTTVSLIVGLAVDDITQWAGPSGWLYSAAAILATIGSSNVIPACLGVHFIQAIYWSSGAGHTFYGDGGIYANGLVSQGMQLTFRM